MISAEVPIMFSKAIEIFITELSLRAWLHTEEAKRRTVQVVNRQTEIQRRQTIVTDILTIETEIL